MMKQLTFRERQLIAAFRRCDERGRAFVERAAIDQAELFSAPEQMRPPVTRLELVRKEVRHA
jgi:hypothetical protein